MNKEMKIEIINMLINSLREEARKSAYFNEKYQVFNRVMCNDGFSFSMQASYSHYCSPRISNSAYYISAELGFPSEPDELIGNYAEDYSNQTETVYGWVPLEIIYDLILKHGGLSIDKMIVGITEKFVDK